MRLFLEVGRYVYNYEELQHFCQTMQSWNIPSIPLFVASITMENFALVTEFRYGEIVLHIECTARARHVAFWDSQFQSCSSWRWLLWVKAGSINAMHACLLAGHVEIVERNGYWSIGSSDNGGTRHQVRCILWVHVAIFNKGIGCLCGWILCIEYISWRILTIKSVFDVAKLSKICQ